MTPASVPSEAAWLTTRDAAVRTGVAVNTIVGACWRGELAAEKDERGRYRISSDELERWMRWRPVRDAEHPWRVSGRTSYAARSTRAPVGTRGRM